MPKSTGSTGQIRFYIPCGYDSGKMPEQMRDASHYLLNLIHWKWLRWKADDQGYIRLKWEYLTKVIPRGHWQAVVRTLEKAGVIEVDRLAIRGVRACGYRLRPGYRKTHRVDCQNPKIARKIRLLQSRLDSSTSGPVMRWLHGNFAALGWDAKEAHRIIATMKPKPNSGLSIREYREILLCQAQKLEHRAFFFSRDRYGRVHTSITSLPKELRSCLSVAGESLAGIDLANSQPLVAGLLAAQFHGGSADVRSQLANQTYDRHPRKARRLKALAPVPNKPDINEYIALCERGKFYEFFIDGDYDRDHIKKQIFNLLFGKSHWRSPFQDRMAQDFPSIVEMLFKLKQGDHRRVAWLLQSLESRIFIDTICRRVMSTHPKIPVYTIHDCLLVPSRAANIIEKLMKEEFGKLGLSPTFDIEYYGSHH